jgi:Regulator of ribonuclease activity B
LEKEGLMLFPDDENGDVLRRMEAGGDDLARPRNIDFAVAFADESSADKFAEHFREFGHEVSVGKDESGQNLPWDVIAVQHMVPSYEGITNFENLLQSVADRWKGQNDGWGCFSGPS